ncbi:MAG: hypothetical protein ACR2Q4_08355 [Geminicoccaceae bacterium]
MPIRSIGAVFAVGLLVSSMQASAADALMGNPLIATPLVLKDGRIAEVSVHSIPFPKDTASLAPNTARDLAGFTREMATDCFLTAQIIGHVGGKETRDRETLEIHRLARARADAIQKSLVGYGLPADSIASVWDWKFLVREARATLWVFRLAAGDDCDDKALPIGEGAKVAEATSPGTLAPVADEFKADQAPDPASLANDRVIAAAKPTEATVTKPIPAVKPKTVETKTEMKPLDEEPETASSQETNPETVVVEAAQRKPVSEVDGIRQIKPAKASSDINAGPRQLAALSAGDPGIDKKGRVAVIEGGTLEIVFATNSSYLPEGAGDQLRAFVESLEKSGSHSLKILTSIDNDAAVAGTKSIDEAVRYNTWLANRRFERVKSWLMQNGHGRDLQIESILLDDDKSRRVRVQINPLG